jgi:hypothetical protein
MERKSKSSRRRSRWIPLAALALARIGVGGVLGWRSIATDALREVEMQIDAYDCGGDGTVVRNKSQVTTVKTPDNMRCAFSVQVHNSSERDVHLGDVRAVLMGPRTGVTSDDDGREHDA